MQVAKATAASAASRLPYCSVMPPAHRSAAQPCAGLWPTVPLAFLARRGCPSAGVQPDYGAPWPTSSKRDLIFIESSRTP
eukprot:681057-Alexandrium_andersonii.AAC.1